MKTSNLCMILFTALAIAACSKYNEFPEESSEDPNTGAPDAYTSIATRFPILL